MIIEQTILSSLLANAELTSVFGDRFFNAFVPEGTKKPYVRFQQVTSDPSENNSGSTFDKGARIQIDSFADNLLEAKENQKTIKKALESGSENFNYQVSILNGFTFYDRSTRLHISTTDYRLFFN